MNTIYPSVKDLQISGLQWFDGNAWKAAIEYYLNGMADGYVSVTYRPKIAFGDVTLRLVGDVYVAYANNGDNIIDIPASIEDAVVVDLRPDQTLTVRDNLRATVEGALRQFISNDSLIALVVISSAGREFFIVKEIDGTIVVGGDLMTMEEFHESATGATKSE